MPDNKNQNQNKDKDKDKDKNFGRQQQGNKGQQQGNKGAPHIEKEDVKKVGNDNDVDLDADLDEDERITQRQGRMGDEGQQRDMNRGGDKNRQ